MTTNQFYNLPLGVNFTMNELFTIQYSIFVNYKKQEADGYLAYAKETKKLFDKLTEIINTYNRI